MGPTRLSALESDQIRLCRILCIFFMMYVHFGAKIHDPGFAHAALYADVVFVIRDFIGRASVAVLSLISGYLLALACERVPPGRIVSAKFRKIYVPMVIWNAVFLALVWVRLRISGDAGAYWTYFDQGLLGFPVVDGLLNLTGAYAKHPLFFLRELFVAIVLILLLRGAILRWFAVLGPLYLVLITQVSLDPVIVRGTVLFFAASGFVLAHRGVTISRLSQPRIALPVALVAGTSFFLLAGGEYVFSPNTPENILRRVFLIAVALYLTHRLSRLAGVRALLFVEKYLFLAYLSHFVLFQVIYAVTRRIGFTNDDASYIWLVAASSFLALAGGAALYHLGQGLAWLHSVHLPRWSGIARPQRNVSAWDPLRHGKLQSRRHLAGRIWSQGTGHRRD
ncbi:MAG: acyltransferase [Pseudomonadota bacterium]